MRDTPDDPAHRWWETYFDEAFVRLYRPFLTPERTEREVRGIEEILRPEPGARLLDLACGWGRHAVALAERGYDVTGLDLSETLLAEARRRATEAGVRVRWVRADVREVASAAPGPFDAALCLFSSLGYFPDPADDLRVLRGVREALRPGGWLLLETMHRDHVVAGYADRDWWEDDDGTTVWVEREWDAVEGVSREWLRWRRGAEAGEKHHSIRVRTATEWDALLREADLAPAEWWGDWELAPFLHTSENLIVAARRPR